VKKIGTMTEAQRLNWLAEIEPELFKHSYQEDDGYVLRDYWAYTKRRVLHVKICPGGKLHPHHDDAGTRTQFVLQTNHHAMSYLDGKAYYLELGGIYEFNSARTHGADNEGETDRIHRIEL
jgi:hypothetical protein